jgi:hypothetical protein
MYLNTVWMLYHFQRLAAMSLLSPAFPPMAFPQTLRRRLVVSIAGRRFSAIAAVLG